MSCTWVALQVSKLITSLIQHFEADFPWKKVNFRGEKTGTTLFQHSIEHHVICDCVLKAFQCTQYNTQDFGLQHHFNVCFYQVLMYKTLTHEIMDYWMFWGSNFASPTPFGSISCFVIKACLLNYKHYSFLIHQKFYSRGYQ